VIRGLARDEEWAFFEPFVIGTGPKRGRPPKDHRRVLDGVFWIARTGAPWRDLPPAFGAWASVRRQFRRWTLSGLWELMPEALNDAYGAPDSLQMIDGAIARAHRSAAGARRGFKARGSGALAFGGRSVHRKDRVPTSPCPPGSTSGRTAPHGP
jgi:transposase